MLSWYQCQYIKGRYTGYPYVNIYTWGQPGIATIVRARLIKQLVGTEGTEGTGTVVPNIYTAVFPM